jgi:hypothetical protein
LAIRGQGNAETQQIFRQLVSATLINESVYMPINHYLLPLEQDGNLSFAELWVDPDDESTPSSQDQSTVKLLLQIDVPAFGQFDIVLTNQDRNVDVQIACPKTAVPYSRQFEDAVSQIMTQSGLNATGIRVRSTERPLSLGEVFPKIMEGKDCVNVKV